MRVGDDQRLCAGRLFPVGADWRAGAYPAPVGLCDDADAFGVTLRQRLIEDAGIDEKDLLNDDGEHLYYIALAYQNGIRTEPDPAKAANIFRMSAENGCCEAWVKLITMYHLGSGVAWDPNKALEYCEKAEAAMKPYEGSSLRNDNALADVYDEKVRIYSRLGNEEGTLQACWQAVDLRKKMQAIYEDAPLGKYCESVLNIATLMFEAGLFADAGDLLAGFVIENGLMLEDEAASDVSAEDIAMLRVRARIYSSLVAVFIQLKRHTDVIRYARKVTGRSVLESCGLPQKYRSVRGGHLYRQVY